MDIEYDLSDVESFLNNEMTNVKEKQTEIGEKAVLFAKKNGNYRDRTGNLRHSNESEVLEDGLGIFNSADYASQVESRGYEVISSAALYAENECKKEFER